jgi:hypothetical protein
MIPIPAMILGGHLAVTVADRPPTINLEQGCRQMTSGENRRANDRFEDCVTAEKHARDQVAAQWSSFDAGARTRCASTATSGQVASYIELLVCLELDQADREVRGAGRGVGSTIMAPMAPGRAGDEATDPSQSRPGPVAPPSRPVPVTVPSPPAPPVAAPSRPPPVAAVPPSRPAPAPRSPQQPVAGAVAPAEPPQAAPMPISPAPLSPSPQAPAPQRPSEAELLHQSLCRSPLGYIVSSCP